MSIVIKGMEVPQNCAQCFLRVGGCKERIYMETRPKRCPIEPLATINTDTICREAATDALKVAYWDTDIQMAKDDPCIVDAMTDWAIRQIKALPSAQPEQKKGKWIIRDNPGTGWYRVTCSECGEDVTSTIPMIGFFPDAKPLWDYCPYCGAKMEVEDNGKQ